MASELVCSKCGKTDEYTVKKNNQHLTAYCMCGAFLKHLPQEEARFYFGKYKGMFVKEVDDLGYLEWVWNNVKMNAHFKDAVDKQISSLVTITR